MRRSVILIGFSDSGNAEHLKALMDASLGKGACIIATPEQEQQLKKMEEKLVLNYELPPLQNIDMYPKPKSRFHK